MTPAISAGTVCCIVWAAVDKQEGRPACCEVFALDLHFTAPAAGPEGAALQCQLTCGTVTLLKVGRCKDAVCRNLKLAADVGVSVCVSALCGQLQVVDS